MKKSILLLIALLFSFAVSSQIPTGGLQVGQPVPDIILTNLHNYYNEKGEAVSTLKLSTFKDKLLIIDFWATWCAPCVAMVPGMERLQTKFNGKVQFLSATYQQADEALPFLERLEKQLNLNLTIPQVVDSKLLQSLFPHRFIPHYIWIDQRGIVRAITGPDEVSEKNVQAMLSGGVTLPLKKDNKLIHDKSKPLFFNGNGGNGEQMQFYSLLAGYTPGLGSGFSQDVMWLARENKKGRIVCTNTSLAMLFMVAYGEGTKDFQFNQVEVRSTNSRAIWSKGFENDKTWLGENSYCYELRTPADLVEQTFKIMQRDLALFFPKFKAHIEVRTVPTYVLTRTSSIDKIASKGDPSKVSFDRYHGEIKNEYIGHLIVNLRKYLQLTPYTFRNETKYKQKVDLEINADLMDMDAINKQLEAYDLHFDLVSRPVEFLVISDNN